MSRNSRRNDRRDRLNSLDTVIQTEAMLEAICEKRKLCYLLVFTETNPIKLTVFHERHEHKETRTVPRHFSVEDLLHLTDDLCDKWHKANSKH
jgi:hypothetical protein